MRTVAATRPPSLLALCALGWLGCGTDQGTPLSKIVGRSLDLDDLPSVGLRAQACVRLVPGAVDATLNGVPMLVESGSQDSSLSFYGSRCHWPQFEPSVAPDPESMATVVIKDSEITMRAVITNVHWQTPQLEPPPTTPMTFHVGDLVSLPFASIKERPDEAHVSIDTGSSFRPDGTPVCPNPAPPAAEITDGQVQFRVPSGFCAGRAAVFVCVGFSSTQQVVLCENATCISGGRPKQSCQLYDMTFVP